MEKESILDAVSDLPRKRTRVLLSCGPCRTSKLKCNREQPCVQCLKKGRMDLCVYAPKPEKKRPITKGMVARLKRLEGMVREMMDDQGETTGNGWEVGTNVAPPLKTQVIQGERATTYVGATHCLAMLEDIEDIKSYFDESSEPEDESSPNDEFDTLDALPFSRLGSPMSREELLAMLPEKHVADRLVMRYFSAKTPSQSVIHQPTFTKAYTRFWQATDSASLHWISMLFTILALGVFHNSFAAPYEVTADSPLVVKDRIKQYRSCATWALISGKYTHPTVETIPAFILRNESDFILNISAQMHCYLLSGVCLRLMLKMGYHRDPSKLANISPFEGEMRRRQWNMAIQVDTLVSFHMGLPPISHGLDADTQLPHNLEDVDFDPSSPELPPSRPITDYTFMTYTINKARLVNIFTRIAHQAHSLSPPVYGDVMSLDHLHNEAWKAVPPYLHVRPLDECIGDPPHQIIQRFGLASMRHKSICVLHRRYLAEATPNREHDYSRQQCLESAVALLSFQSATWEACGPGNVLGPSAWFMTSLAVHDFMLAAVILYVIIQSDNYADDGTGFGLATGGQPAPRKDELRRMIRRSYDISSRVFNSLTDLKKMASTLSVMLDRLGAPVETTPGTLDMPATNDHNSSGMSSTASASGRSNASASPGAAAPGGLFSVSRAAPPPPALAAMPQRLMGMDVAGTDDMSSLVCGFASDDFSWLVSAADLDWRNLDASIGQGGFSKGGVSDRLLQQQQQQPGAEMLPLDMELVTGEVWH